MVRLVTVEAVIIAVALLDGLTFRLRELVLVLETDTVSACNAR